MSRGKCCCECWDRVYDFDPEQFAPEWDPVRGTWSFVAGKVHVATGADSVLIVTDEPLPRPQHHVVDARFDPALSVGDKPTLILSYVDEDNYFFAEFEVLTVGAGATCDIRLYQRSGGSNNLLQESDEPVDWGNVITAGMTDQFFYGISHGPYADETEIAGYEVYKCDSGRVTSVCGIGNNGPAIDFEKYFRIQEIWPRKTDCPNTICTCKETNAEYCISDDLLLTITLKDGIGCSAYDGLSWAMTRPQGYPGWLRHPGGDPFGPPYECFPFTVYILFFCQQYWNNGSIPAADFGLLIHNAPFLVFPPQWEDIFGFEPLGNITKQCDPFVITFELLLDNSGEPSPGIACCEDGDIQTLVFTITKAP